MKFKMLILILLMASQASCRLFMSECTDQKRVTEIGACSKNSCVIRLEDGTRERSSNALVGDYVCVEWK